MTSEPKFLHIANHRHENLFDVPIMIGGFYNWHKAMNGEFHLFKTREDQLEDYDILFIGMSKPELEGQVATRIRKKIGNNSKTKLVVCIDYAVELWDRAFNPYGLEQELMQADVLFVSEPAMLSHVKALINNRKPVHHLAHPSNIDGLRKYYKAKELRTEEIVTLIHRYDNNWMDPLLATKNLPWNTYAVCLDPNIMVHLYAFYKYLIPGVEFTKYIGWVARKMVMLDSYHKIHTYGRSAVDCACLQVPVVGSTWQWAQNYLWPNTTVEPGDVYGQTQLIKKLMKDEKFYDDCVEIATEKVAHFSYENKRQELLNIIYN